MDKLVGGDAAELQKKTAAAADLLLRQSQLYQNLNVKIYSKDGIVVADQVGITEFCSQR